MLKPSSAKRLLLIPVFLAFVLLTSLHGNLSRISHLSWWFWAGMVGLTVCLGLAGIWLTPRVVNTWSKPRYSLVFGLYLGTLATLTTVLQENLSHSFQYPFALWIFFAGFIGGLVGATFRKSRL